MCRHIGYIGKKKNLYSILLKHDHSLLELAYKPKEMENAKLNADGFGIGWRKNLNFQLYKSTLPIWHDLNLISISKSISSSLVIGNVRSATIAENLGYFNTHPFYYKNFCFSHNGYISNFDLSIKKSLIKNLNDKFLNILQGNTDSELIFVLLMQLIEYTNNVLDSIRQVIKIIKENCSSAMLNFLLAITDKEGNDYLFATKYSIKLKPPTLYYTKDDHKNFIVSSEMLNKDKWIQIEDNCLIKITNNKVKILI